MRRLLLLLAALAMIAPAAGQDSVTVPGAPTTIGRDGQGASYAPSAGGGGGGCSVGQLDFSDGCNTTQYLVILK